MGSQLGGDPTLVFILNEPKFVFVLNLNRYKAVEKFICKNSGSKDLESHLIIVSPLRAFVSSWNSSIHLKICKCKHIGKDITQ